MLIGSFKPIEGNLKATTSVIDALILQRRASSSFREEIQFPRASEVVFDLSDRVNSSHTALAEFDAEIDARSLH